MQYAKSGSYVLKRTNQCQYQYADLDIGTGTGDGNFGLGAQGYPRLE